eukprot:5412062-Pleurochrysis_carterae.AAC.1
MPSVEGGAWGALYPYNIPLGGLAYDWARSAVPRTPFLPPLSCYRGRVGVGERGAGGRGVLPGMITC